MVVGVYGSQRDQDKAFKQAMMEAFEKILLREGRDYEKNRFSTLAEYGMAIYARTKPEYQKEYSPSDEKEEGKVKKCRLGCPRR